MGARQLRDGKQDGVKQRGQMTKQRGIVGGQRG